MESAYQSSNQLFEKLALVNREGMDVQVKEAAARKPGSMLKVDDGLALELTKEGLINRV